MSSRVSPRVPQAPNPAPFFGVRTSAIRETLTFLCIIVALDWLAGDGTRYLHVTLHPFWIIVLLVTLQYGIREALTAAMLAGLFLLAGNMPEQSLSETMYDYILRVTFLPFLWLVTALVLGAVRERQLHEKAVLQARLNKSETAMDAIAKGYNAVKQAKEHLELRLAEERCSVLSVYKMAKALEALDPADIRSGVKELVCMSLKPAKFSLYLLKDHALQLDCTYGWERPDDYVRRFDINAPLTRSVIGKKRHLSIANENDESALAGHGMLAGPIIDEKTGRIFGMLKIEEIGFMDLGMHTHEIFHVVCEWLGRLYANSERHQPTPMQTPQQAKPKTIFQRFMYDRSASNIAA